MNEQATSTDQTSTAGDQTTSASILTAPEAAPAAPEAAEAAAQPQAEAQAAPAEFDLALPEGIPVDEAAASSLMALAKEKGFDQATVQQLAGIAAEMQQRAFEQHAQLTADWVNQVKADPEIGGDRLPEALGHARRALDEFGTPELRALLDETGLGNHPALVRFVVNAGKKLADDGFVASRTAVVERDPAKLLFPSMN